jgi:glycosyltransferase involved in cell wall biosynthesis
MEYRPFYMSREWIRLGHQVTIIASSFSHVRTHQPETVGWCTEEPVEGVNYRWLKAPSYEGNGLRRILNMLAFVLQLLRLSWRVRYERPDVIIASSTYPLDVLPALLFARQSKAKLIFEVHDLWPLSPIELGGFSRRHPFIMAMQFAEDFAYRHADAVVSMLPCALSHMTARGLERHKFFYIPNGVLFSAEECAAISVPHPHVMALQELRAKGRFIVLYAGAHGVANALDSLIDAASLLRDRPVSFVLVGQGPEKDRLQKKCAALGLTNVEFLASVARTNIMDVLRAADVLYISLQRNPLFRFGISPNKLFDYMMAERPVIQAIEAGNDIVGESGCGLTILPEDPDALVAAIDHLIEIGEAERGRLGTSGLRYVMMHHDYRKLAAMFPLSDRGVQQHAFSQ